MKNIISSFLLLALISLITLNLLLIAPAYAQEASEAEVVPVAEPTATPVPSEEPQAETPIIQEPSINNEPVVSPTPTPSDLPEASAEATPSASVTPEPSPSTTPEPSPSAAPTIDNETDSDLSSPEAAPCDMVQIGTDPDSTCYATVQEAVDAASSGDTLYLGTATYNEAVKIVNKSLTLIGAGTGNTYIQSIIANSPTISISDLTVHTLIFDSLAPTITITSPQITNTVLVPDVSIYDGNLSSGISTTDWSTVSGPCTVDLGLSVNGDTALMPQCDGHFLMKISATDNAGNTGSSNLDWIYDTSAPEVTAGNDLTTHSQFNQVGTSLDTTSGIASTTWSMTSGPGSITFSSPNSLITDISADTQGTYIIRLTSTDLAGNTFFDEFTLYWDITGPVVEAGSDQTTNHQITTNASGSDSNGIATYQWSQLSGPGAINFGTPESLNTTISADADGEYQLRLTVTDLAGNSSSDEFTLIWDTTGPVIEAGTTILTSHSFTTMSEGNDNLSGIATIQWTQLNGPGSILFSDPSSLNPTISADLDGTYTLQLTVTDQSGNVSIDEFTLIWDTTTPTISAGTDVVTNQSVTQTGVGDDSNGIATIIWSFVSGPGSVIFTNQNSLTTDISADTDGDYILRLTITDNAGNISNDDINFTWDTISPEVTNGPNITTNTITSSTASYIENGSGVTNILWSQISGPGTLTFTSPTSTTTSISADTDGTYTVRTTIVDAAGNSSYSDLIFIWDNTSPIVSSGTDVITNSQIIKTGEAADLLTSIVSTIWTQVSGPGTITFTDPTNILSSISADIDGLYIIRLSATDSAGNTSFDEFSLIWDTTPAVITLNSDLITNQPISPTASATDENNIATTHWSQISGPGTLVFSDFENLTTTISADIDGIYLVRLTTVDTAGNSSFAEFYLTWDQTSPVVNGGNDSVTNQPITTAASASDNLVGSLTYQWSQISGAGTITFTDPTELNTNLSADIDGIYLLRLTVTDTAGNTSTSDLTITWDQTPPQTDTGADILINQPVVPVTTATDTLAGIESIQWSQISGPGIITFSDLSLINPTISADLDGEYTIRMTVTDLAGNTSFDEFSLVWDTTPPTVTTDGDSQTNQTITRQGIAADLNGITSTIWSQISGPGTITFSSPSTLTTDISADIEGIYVLRLTITDLAGNTNFSDLTLIWDITPAIVDAGTVIITNHSQSTAASASDTLSGISLYSWSQISGPGTIIFDDTYSLQPIFTADLDGEYIIRLTVTDLAGNSSYSDLTIVWDQTTPQVSAGADSISNQTFIQTGTATDPDPTSGLATYLWSQISGPGTVIFGDQTALTTTISASADGQYLIMLTVTDLAGNIQTATFNLLWDTVSPVIDPLVDQTKNSVFAQQASATDPDPSSGNINYIWSQISGPGIITFSDPNSLSTNISADIDGTYIIRITGTDQAGNSSFSEMTLVWDTNSPIITPVSPIITNQAVTPAILVSDNDPSSGNLTYSWSQINGPGLITFSDTTILNPIILADTDGSYIIRLLVTDAAGNTSLLDITYFLDTVAPEANIDLSFPTINGTVTDQNPSSGGITTTWSQISGPGIIIFGDAQSLNTTFTADTDGIYLIRLTVIDAAENSNYTEVTYTRDTLAPNSPAIEVHPVNVANVTNYLFSGSGEADSVINYQITDGTLTITGQSVVMSDGSFSLTGLDLSSLADGTLTLTITLTDGSGNISLPTIQQFEKDTIVPLGSNVTIISSYPDSNYARNGDTITITFTSSESVILPIVTIQNRNADVTQIGQNTYQASLLMLESDPIGYTVFDILLTDLLGNTSHITATTDNSVVYYDHIQPFTASSSSSSTSSTSSGSESGTSPMTPVLISAEQLSPTEVILKWTKLISTFTHYGVVFGTDPDHLSMGSINIGNISTTSFIIKNLKPNQKYYFRIYAVNDKTSSGFSNMVSQTAQKKTSFTSVQKPNLINSQPIEEKTEYKPQEVISYSTLNPVKTAETKSMWNQIWDFFKQTISQIPLV